MADKLKIPPFRADFKSCHTKYGIANIIRMGSQIPIQSRNPGGREHPLILRHASVKNHIENIQKKVYELSPGNPGDWYRIQNRVDEWNPA